MKFRYLLMFFAVIAFSFTSCDDGIITTENPIYDEEATGDDPKLPNGGTGGTGGAGGGTNTVNLTVEEDQRATVTYVGATWCPPCGAFGDPTKLFMERTYGDDVIILNVQSGDAISASGTFGHGFGQAFQSFVGSSSIPHAYWSGANFSMVHRGFTADSSVNNNNASSDINAILVQSPEIGVAASATLEGDSVNVTTLVKFFNAYSNEAFIGIYLLEDKVEALQQITGAANPMVTSHENVIRGSAYTGKSLGTESLGAAFDEDEEIVGSLKIAVPNTVINDGNLQIAVVVWESEQADGISNSIIVDVD